MTYAISSPLKRYDNGTATMPSLRAAWMVTRTSREFGPHQTRRSPAFAPAASKPLARRFTAALSSANVVVDARAPPLLSTITAVLSGCACACMASTSGVAFIFSPQVARSWCLRHRGAVTLTAVTGRAFGVRGIVEGFYGAPWTHAARLDVLAFVARAG